MPRSDASCLRCRSLLFDAGPQRLCPSCVGELRGGDSIARAALFQPGDCVTVIEGVFAGQQATIVGRDDQSGLILARSLIMKIPLEIDYMPWQLLREGELSL